METNISPEIKPRRSSKRPWLVAALAVALIAIAGIGPRLTQAQKLKHQVADLTASAPVVSTVRLSTTPNESDLTLPSNVQAIDQTTINARTSGYLVKRYVDIGSKVTRGQLLAVVESPELDQQLSQSVAQTSQARAGMGSAQADSVKLLAAISEARSDEAKSEANRMQAQADLAHLNAKLQESQSAVSVAKSRQMSAEKRYTQAQANLRRNQAELDLARKTLARWKELEKAAAVSGQEVDEKQAAYDSSQAQVESADAAVSSAKADAEAATEDVQSAMSEVAAARADVQSGVGRVQAANSAVASSKANIQASQAGYSASRSTVEAAGASVVSSEANTNRIGALQSFERITAPFSGVITARNVDVGDLINSTTPGSGASDQTSAVTHTGLFGLANTSSLRLQVNVPEQDIPDVHDGQTTDVTVAEYPNRVFHGRVFNVSGALDSTSRTLLVEVRVPNLDGALKPGMFAQIKFDGSKGHPIIWLPADALVFNANGTRVATVTADSKLHYVTVKLGRDLGDKLEVLEGLNGSETVIVNPDDSVAEGTVVKSVEASK